MKDIIIDTRRQKRELWYLAGAFIIANLLNIWAIYRFNGSIKEIYTSFFYVLIFTLFIYALSVLVRIAAYGVRRMVSHKKVNTTNQL